MNGVDGYSAQEKDGELAQEKARWRIHDAGAFQTVYRHQRLVKDPYQWQDYREHAKCFDSCLEWDAVVYKR